MRSILTYSRNDIRLIFRDPILYIMFFVPLIFIVLLRIGLPALSAVFPEIESYTVIFPGTFCLIISMFPAFIYSFIILDEKDQDVITVFRVLPISSIEFLLVRLSFITLSSCLFINVIIASTGIVSWSAGKIFLASLPISLIAPVMCLFMVSFARNKIEGATWMKGLNFIIFLPVLSYFIQGPYEYILGILPVYWIFKMFEPGFSAILYSVNYIIALIYHFILLLAGVRIYRCRMFP